MSNDRKQCLAPDFQWLPPTTDREPVLIHPDAKSALRALLVNEPEYHEMGYSEFIMRAVVEARGRLALDPETSQV